MVSINQPLNFLLPEDLAAQIGQRVRARRLALDLTRKTLAQRSGVPESTLRKFEITGAIGFVGLLRLADALGCMDDFSTLFPARAAVSIDEFVAPARQRGRK